MRKKTTKDILEQVCLEVEARERMRDNRYGRKPPGRQRPGIWPRVLSVSSRPIASESILKNFGISRQRDSPISTSQLSGPEELRLRTRRRKRTVRVPS